MVREISLFGGARFPFQGHTRIPPSPFLVAKRPTWSLWLDHRRRVLGVLLARQRIRRLLALIDRLEHSGSHGDGRPRTRQVF